MTDLIRVVGFRSVTVWMRRVVARLPETAGKEIIQDFSRKVVKSAQINLQTDAIYHSERPGMLGKSIAWHMEGEYQAVVDSTHPGAEAAEYGMRSVKQGYKRVRLRSGKWRIVKAPGEVMTQSRALNYMANAIESVTRTMDGIVNRSLNKRLGMV